EKVVLESWLEVVAREALLAYDLDYLGTCPDDRHLAEDIAQALEKKISDTWKGDILRADVKSTTDGVVKRFKRWSEFRLPFVEVISEAIGHVLAASPAEEEVLPVLIECLTHDVFLRAWRQRFDSPPNFTYVSDAARNAAETAWEAIWPEKKAAGKVEQNL